MSARRTREDRRLAACADAARANLRVDALELEACGDRALRGLGAARHPFVALGAATATGVLLGKLGAGHAGSALRRGGSAAVRAVRWSSLLF